ncbi:hypothetical protein B296_00052086 [Ensete ventricosum]|uniref:Uncharacterized protein n=1 Tax=Ensete ventricosum TaxID=4639 RepID=A0A426X9G7_ENSVE|nr:hypothetical protein B296_00052086 [Ensete ventricosum]
MALAGKEATTGDHRGGVLAASLLLVEGRISGLKAGGDRGRGALTKEAADEGRRDRRCRAAEGEVMQQKLRSKLRLTLGSLQIMRATCSSSFVRQTTGDRISSSSSMPSWQKEAEYVDAEGYLLLLC